MHHDAVIFHLKCFDALMYKKTTFLDWVAVVIMFYFVHGNRILTFTLCSSGPLRGARGLAS